MYVYISLSDSPFLLSLFYLCRSHFLCLPLARSHAKWRCYPTGRCNFRLSVTCDWWERERKESDRPSFTIDCQTPLSLSLSPPRNSFNHAEGAPSQVKQHPRRFSGQQHPQRCSGLQHPQRFSAFALNAPKSTLRNSARRASRPPVGARPLGFVHTGFVHTHRC